MLTCNPGEDTKSTETLKNQNRYIVTRFEQVKKLSEKDRDPALGSLLDFVIRESPTSERLLNSGGGALESCAG